MLATALPGQLERVSGTRSLLAGSVNALAALAFLLVGDPAYGAAALIAVGGIAGGVLGARVGRRLGATTLRAVVVVVGLAAIVQLLL